MRNPFKRSKGKDDLEFAQDVVLETTEVDIELRPTKVEEDHHITYKGRSGDKKSRINPHLSAKQLVIPYKELFPKDRGGNRLDKIKDWFAKRRLPKTLLFRVYTIQAEGEMTHDPHADKLDPEMKMKLEKLLQLEGKFAEVEAGKYLYEGMEKKKKWEDYIPYIVIGVIVFMFLFAFQIQPNM